MWLYLKGGSQGSGKEQASENRLQKISGRIFSFSFLTYRGDAEKKMEENDPLVALAVREIERDSMGPLGQRTNYFCGGFGRNYNPFVAFRRLPE